MSKIIKLVKHPHAIIPVISILISVFVPIIASAQGFNPIEKKVNYSIDNIPVQLISGVNSVIRYYAEDFDVQNKGRAAEKVRLAITVLNANAKSSGVIVLPYDKFRRIKKLNGKIYDKNGKLIRKLKKSDIKDYTANFGESLYQDSRVKIASLYGDQYPYTIEYTYQIDHNGLINWPSWRPVQPDQSVQESVFQVRLPGDVHLRYKEYGFQIKPMVAMDGSHKVYQWNLKNRDKITIENDGPPDYRQLPHMITAPDVFEISHTVGEMKTWKDFGAWYNTLIKGRQKLPEAVEKRVHSLVDNVSDPVQKTKLLYRYLQKNTHYISVQLGIGGWQPFDANYVYNHGYGDCKALTNYMMSLLRAVNIRSIPALVDAGSDAPDIHAGFPSNQFNHAILCVPFRKDTVWLECTSQTIPFNTLGDFTSNRHVLLITSSGGKLVKTPSTHADDNREIRFINLSVSPDGNAVADVKTRFTGDQMIDFSEVIKNSTVDKQKKWLHNRISIPNFNLDHYDVAFQNSERDTSRLLMKLTLPDYASVMGRRIFIAPNLMNRATYIPEPTQKRKYPVYFSYPYFDTDSVLIHVPKGFQVESLPDPVHVKKTFGSYDSRILVLKNGDLLYIRHMKMNTYKLPATDFEQYRMFRKKIVEADKNILALVKK